MPNLIGNPIQPGRSGRAFTALVRWSFGSASGNRESWSHCSTGLQVFRFAKGSPHDCFTHSTQSCTIPVSASKIHLG